MEQIWTLKGVNPEDIKSFDELKDFLGNNDDAHQILKEMIEYMRNIVKVSGEDMKRIDNQFKEGNYNNTLVIIESIHKKYLKRKNISQTATLLEMIMSDGRTGLKAS